MKLLKKRWFTKRGEYEDKLEAMYSEMILHISESSLNLIQTFQEEYAACVEEKDPRGLINLIKKSHTQAGRVASREEKEAKKDRLKNHRQWDNAGKVHDIHDHNERFRMLLDDTKELGIEWTEEDIVDIYLKSVDNSMIEADLARIKVSGSAEMPTTLSDAMFWVIDTNRTNKAIKENKPNGSKRKATGMSDNPQVHTVSAPSKKHNGGDQSGTCLLRQPARLERCTVHFARRSTLVEHKIVFISKL